MKENFANCPVEKRHDLSQREGEVGSEKRTGTKSFHTSSRWLFNACLIAALGWFTPIASAQDTNRFDAPAFLGTNPDMTARFPTKPANPLGWTMRVQISPHSTADVMRIEIDVATTGGPTTADQTVTVRMNPIASGHAPPQSSMAITVPVEIPQGTRKLRVARHAPKSSYGNLYQIQLYQDGRKIDDCQANVGASIAYRDSALYFNQAAQNHISVLWINHQSDQDSQSESFQHGLLSLGVYPFNAADTPQEWKDNLADSVESGGVESGGVESGGPFQFRTVDAKDLASNWLAYRPYDCIVMHVDGWNEFQTQDSPAANAIRIWNQSGGVVLVRGGSVGDRSKRIVVSQASEIGSNPSIESTKAAANVARKLSDELTAFGNSDSSIFQSETAYRDLSEDQIRKWEEWFPQGGQLIRDSLAAYPPESIVLPEGVRAESNLAGLVIHLGQQEPEAPVQILQWAAATELMSWKRHRLLRSGVEPILGSSRFFQWSIPGVAQPPVYTFMGLLGVFVILVGPVAYRKTAKSGRSYLMFAIAPLLAIATTLSMLVYGVLADGFGTQTRVRQISWFDARTGQGVTRTRSTYFAGIRPSAGLSFPGDADVTVYPDNQQRSWEERMEDRFDTRGEVVVADRTIRFNQNFLPSRQQRQFVVQRPCSFSGRLVVDAKPGDAPGKTSPETINVGNEFDRDVTEVLVCDAKGAYYFAEQIKSGATANAILLEDKKASERLGEMYKRQWLVSSVVDRRESRALSMRRYNNEVFDLLTNQLGEIESVAKPTDGLFEFELQMRMQLGSKLPRNSFLCLTGLTDEAIAVEGAAPTESIHFVMGALPQ